MTLWDELKKLNKKARNALLRDICNEPYDPYDSERQVRYVRAPQDNAKIEGREIEIDLEVEPCLSSHHKTVK